MRWPIRFVIVLALCLFASGALAKPTGYIEGSVQMQHGTRAMGLVDGSLAWTLPETQDQMGFYAFFWIQEGWAQVYFGPTYTPKQASWLTLGVHLGVEQVPGTAEARLRYATTILIAYDLFTFIGAVEFCNDAATGADRTCIMYDLTAKAKAFGITKATETGDAPQFGLAFGLRGHRYAGIGPLMEIQIPVAYTTVWLNWIPLEPEGWDHWATAKGGPRFNASRFWLGLALGF